jgi:predicted AAA+ superfamily ATPase
MIVYKNIAQDCGVSANTVKEYFNILEQTMVGYLIPGFLATMKRRAIAASKFYYFDVGIVNYLLKRKNIEQGTDIFGKAFEHLLMQEIIAYLGYGLSDEKISYWRTSSGSYEVDCIIGDGRVAIEFKSGNEIKSRHTKGLTAFREEYPKVRAIIVSMDKYRRQLNEIEVIPAVEFLSDLWAGKIL